MRRLWPAGLAVVCLVLTLAAPTAAKDLGTRGATWPVAEPDLLAQIEARLAGMQRSGELARLQEDARARARRSLEDPEPVPGIVPARERRSRPFDPSIVVARDLRGPDGALIAAAGTRIDPFAHLPPTRDLLFVDGRREVEVAWALAHPRPAKIVLLAGRPLALMRAHGRPFFFDRGGRLAARFAVRATPTLLARDGALLRLTEIPLEDRPAPASGARRCADGPPDAATSARPTDRRNEPC